MRDLEALLLARISAHQSWAEWERSRQTQGLPALRNDLVALQSTLLAHEMTGSLPLYSVRGAFQPLLDFLPAMIEDEMDLGRLQRPLSDLTVKVSLDGRKLRGNSNVGWFASILESSEVQHPDAQYTFAVADMHEPDLEDGAVWPEIGLDEAVAALRTRPLVVAGESVQVNFILCGDWKALSYVVGFAPANSAAEAEVCGWCGAQKAFLNGAWLEGGVFTRWGVDYTRTIREIPSLPIWRARYDPMHGCNRLLDNHLRLLQGLGAAREIKAVVREVSSQWGKKGALRPVETKAFYDRHQDDAVVALFAGTTEEYRLLQPDGLQIVVTRQEMARRTLSACRAYWTFSRLRQPGPPDFTMLLQARDALLSIAHAVRAPLAPTTHYMTSHFVDFAELDGTAYTLLQEGAEHHHKTDRNFASMVFTCGGSLYDGRGPMQQLLDLQQLHRILMRRRRQLWPLVAPVSL